MSIAQKLVFEYFEYAIIVNMSKKALTNPTVLPPEEQQDREDMFSLVRFLEQQSTAVLLGPDGEQIKLPFEVFKTLMTVVEAMSEGNAITVAPVHKMLTTQEASQFLGVSRPTVVKLLEEGAIPFEKTSSGRHRRVRLTDLLNYQNILREQRRRILDEMADDTHQAGLYETAPEQYSDALKQARAMK